MWNTQRLTAAIVLKTLMKNSIELFYARICAVWTCLTAREWCVSTVKRTALETSGTLSVSDVTSCLLVAILRKNFGEKEQDARVEMFKAILSAKRAEMKVWNEDGTVRSLTTD